MLFAYERPLCARSGPSSNLAFDSYRTFACKSQAVRIRRRRRAAATDFNAASTLPAGLAQTLDEMSVVFRPKPRSSVADIHVECRRCAGDGLLQCFLRFRCAPKLAQRRRVPAVDHRKIRIGPDQPFRGHDRSLVFAAEI